MTACNWGVTQQVSLKAEHLICFELLDGFFSVRFCHHSDSRCMHTTDVSKSWLTQWHSIVWVQAAIIPCCMGDAMRSFGACHSLLIAAEIMSGI